MIQRDRIPIPVIRDMLSARIGDLCRHLFANGVRCGHEFRVGSLDGERGQSLGIHLDGPRAGVWQDFASGEAGDALDLVAQALYGGDKGEAIKWAKAWLGLDGCDPAALRTTRRAVAAKADEPSADEDAEKRRRNAQAIFLHGLPDLIGTPVDIYLGGRAIRLPDLPYPVRAIRFHPALWNRESQRKWPGMVAGICGPDGKFLGVHRTWLEVHADGRVTKAPLAEPKMTLGDFRGGAIRLWRGITIDPETGEVRQAKRLSEAGPGVWVDLSEGIEDGLSVAIALPEHRVLAAATVGNLANVLLPDNVVGVTMWRQNDPAGSKAEAGFDRAVEAHRARGLRVRVPRPPEGVKDVNDMLQGAA